jgi:hypothetical protein
MSTLALRVKDDALDFSSSYRRRGEPLLCRNKYQAFPLDRIV